MKVVFSAAARTDLRAIDAAASVDSPQAAQQLMATLRSACLGLGDMPNRFRQVGNSGLRLRPCGNYLIFYAVSEGVEIVRILHGARDWAAILDED
jgi:plasmid stabilization system protein ParE